MLLAVCAVCAALLAGCKKDSDRVKILGSAFAGPIELNLREEISPASKTIATVKHGEKLDILQVRRRFVRVRTPSGQEGWTDSRNLLSTRQMEELEDLSKRAAKLPSQGAATVYGLLNVHLEPYRQSTTFYQITEGVQVDVLAHKLSARNAAPPSNTLDLKKPAPPPKRRKKKKEPDYPPPPMPPAPALPANWVKLSITPEPEPPPAPPEELKGKKQKRRQRPRPEGPPMEDWTLVRTKDGKAGWVLSRMLVMAIPDEVAQYSEGARITSYFPLGTVQDEGQTKHHWLWTTVRDPNVPHQFDSFRVFTYVVRRHRYETAYIERNIEGYYPVEVVPGAMPKFSLVLRGEDGRLYRKTWVMEGYMVRKVAEEPYVPPEDDESGGKVSDSLADRLRALLE